MLGLNWTEKKVTRIRLSFELPLDAKSFGGALRKIESHPMYKKYSQYDDAYQVTSDGEYLYITFPEEDTDE